MDDIIWSVNPQNDSLSSLVVRLREFAVQVCESKNINFLMNVNETIYSMKLGMDERRNIFLIVKEAVNNAVKHSGCQKLSVTFSKNPELEISVQDDGSGFDAALPTSRNGLVNIRRRANQIGCELMLHSEKGIGTTITLKTKTI
jgi:signal transduction histidine kinase